MAPAIRPRKILLGADVKGESIAVGGWTETTEINVFDFLQQYIDQGITNVFCTDVSKDGLLEGPSAELYKKSSNAFLHYISLPAAA